MGFYVENVIGVAEKEVGYLEKASNKNLDSKTANAGKANYTKYARDLDAIPGFYNGKKNGYSWCDVFVDWCFVQAFGAVEAKRLLCQPSKSLGAGCSYSMKYYLTEGRVKDTPAVGDQIFFTDKNGSVCHTGIVYAVDKTYVYTIEGNTSSESGVVANGGCVAKKKYKKTYNRIAGYGRPAYDVSKPYKPTVLEWQKAAIADGFKFPKCGADGKWGSECKSVAKDAVVKKRLVHKYKNLTKIVQKYLGVEVDGKCGSETDKAIRAYQKSNYLEVDGAVGLKTWTDILDV